MREHCVIHRTLKQLGLSNNLKKKFETQAVFNLLISCSVSLSLSLVLALSYLCLWLCFLFLSVSFSVAPVSLCLQFLPSLASLYLTVFIILSSHYFPSNRLSLLFHIHNKTMPIILQIILPPFKRSAQMTG